MEIRTITAGQLEKQRVATITVRLKRLQTALQELDSGIAEAEEMHPLLEKELQKQERDYAKVQQSTAEQMQALGLGPKADMLAVNPRAAQTEFEHRVQQSEIVKGAAAEVRQAREQLKGNQQLLQRLSERQAESATVLERFIARSTGVDQ